MARADYIVQGQNFMPLPNDVVGKLQTVEGVQGVSGLDIQQVQVDKKLTAVNAVDPATFGPLWRFDWLGGGNDQLLQELGTSRRCSSSRPRRHSG